MREIVDRLGDVESIDHYDVADLSVGRRIVYDVKANWKLIIENFMECYHCATIHPELTEVLPEFADGYAAQFFVGHGAEFGEDVKGFTVDGSEGFDRLPGVDRGPGPPLLRDHRAGRRCSSTWCPTTSSSTGCSRWRPTARSSSATGCTCPTSSSAGSDVEPVGGAVPPGQPAGLRRLRALPAGDGLPRLRRRRGAGAQRAPHRRVPRLAARQARRVTSPPVSRGRYNGSAAPRGASQTPPRRRPTAGPGTARLPSVRRIRRPTATGSG